MTYAHGRRYEGAWAKNVPHGPGALVGADGTRDAGEWREGRRVP